MPREVDLSIKVEILNASCDGWCRGLKINGWNL
jgi:hypothetical protein